MKKIIEQCVKIFLMFKFLIFNIFLAFHAHALKLPVVEILEVSSSGRTLILNIGEFEGLKKEDYGILIQQESGHLSFLASGIVKKVNNYQSLWFLDETVFLRTLRVRISYALQLLQCFSVDKSRFR